ncbi:hydantoinase/oxoprolinase family protein, partial [candidate division KSB1 bacterium]|nr:hydantoinase/oxoprolinase family protein [candidate division KSB1 bacterium]
MSKNSTTLIGIDTGGTFSDFVYIRNGKIRVLKILSTPKNPGEAILTGIKRILSRSAALAVPNGNEIPQDKEFDYSIIHGSTVATNALLERKGARTALITTKGFKDILEIGRQNRAEIYNIYVDRPQPLIPSSRRFEINERTLHDGSILKEINPDECDELLKKIESENITVLAVCFLHSYANAKNEKTFARKARSKNFNVSLSSEILPEYREFERMSTTTVNAYVAPIMNAYLNSLQKNLPDISLRVMKSNGGIISAHSAGKESVNTILSGPAGGVVGAFAAGKQAGYGNIITFDMGGTSTDVALCPGQIPMTSESNVAGCPIKIPMIDIHTVGAGGGSIASLDAGGALRVGPESAGADPGPAGYGKGNDLTVTDANLYLNRLDPGHFLGGEMKIDSRRLDSVMSKKSKQFNMDPVTLAAGIVQVVNSNMEKALRVISIERGFNPADFAIVSFGGAGALHAAELARPLNIKTIIIPKNPGIYSAIGMLYSDFVKDYSRTVLLRIGSVRSPRGRSRLGQTASSIIAKLEKRFHPVEKQAHREMLNEGIAIEKIAIKKFIDVRYKGQSYELTVPYSRNFLAAFHKAHEQFYGFSDRQRETEVVTIRIKCTGKTTNPRINKIIPG